MKYEYVTFRKIKSKWESDPEVPTLNFTNKAKAQDHIIGRHDLWHGLGWSGSHVKSVTRLCKGGDKKDTEGFDYFFDYTYAPTATTRIRCREAIRRTK